MKSKFKIDEVILILIVSVIIIVVSLLINNKAAKQSLDMGPEQLTELILNNHDISFANGGIIDENRLKVIQTMDYEEVKELLNIKNDFCIYVIDGHGNIILAKGAEKLSRDGLYCKE